MEGIKVYTGNETIPAPSKGCQMVPKGCQKKKHPLGFNWHPFEGAGT